ncbi:MAG: Uma2 family endonuclease [Cyanobacteriota bacterium]|nr:Uma2 family endonuclease [Cyanobacteriota bacterium]
MVQFDPKLRLPTSDELPDSDGLPVDNELHTLVTNLLGLILGFIWGQRFDWFLGVNMGIYHTTGINPRVPIVPDGFLSLGVERVRGNQLRKSYVVWEENDIIPIFVLEIVSQTPGGEYDEKLLIYAKLGVLYYVIYNPDFWRRDQQEPFEVYQLVKGSYQRQIGEPFWMPEIGLGIGSYRGLQRECLYWFDQRGNRILTPEELLARYQEQFGELPGDE